MTNKFYFGKIHFLIPVVLPISICEEIHQEGLMCFNFTWHKLYKSALQTDIWQSCPLYMKRQGLEIWLKTLWNTCMKLVLEYVIRDIEGYPRNLAMFLTLTVSVPVVPADSQSAPPAHPETSAASWSGYETHPTGQPNNNTSTHIYIHRNTRICNK